MKVILLKSVPKVGKKDDIVEVNEGYAVNALFPKRFAVPATPAAVDALKTRQKQKVAEKDIQNNLLDRFIEQLSENPLVIHVSTNKQGGLFSSIDEKDIAKELQKQRSVSIEAKKLEIDGGVIKQTGVFSVLVKEQKKTFAVHIVAGK